jgi:hypothetical protein
LGMLFFLAMASPLIMILAITIGLFAYIYQEYRKQNGKV